MTLERCAPYVGISGIVDPVQQSRYEKAWSEAGLSGVRNLLLGVKAVHNTQWCDVPNKYGSNWYPVGEDAFHRALWPRYLSNDDEMGVAQMYLDPATIHDDPSYPERFVERVMVRGQEWLTHIQFDMLPFHEPDSEKWGELIQRIRGNGVGVIMQCHQPAMQLGINAALDKLRRLPPLDYILFDASHGTGKRLSADALLPFLEAAYNDEDLAASGTNFGIAGGLESQVIHDAMPTIIRYFPDISWDAEGRLHDPWQGEATTRGLLNDQAVTDYLHASGKVVNR